MCYNNIHGDTEREEKQIVYNYMHHIKTNLYKRPQNEIYLPSADTFIRDDKEEIYGILYYIMGLEMRVILQVAHLIGTFVVSLSVSKFKKKKKNSLHTLLSDEDISTDFNHIHDNASAT